MSISLKELAERIGADIESVPEAIASKTITGVNSLRNASSTEISFLSSDAHLEDLKATNASAVVVHADHVEGCPIPAVIHEQPYIAYALISAVFSPTRPQDGVHSSAVIAEGVKIGSGVCISANVVIDENAEIGNDVHIGSNVSIGENAIIGSGSHIYPNVCIYRDVIVGENCIVHAGTVIGSDGFGFAPSSEGWIKIHQLGTVRIGNDVEIGSNCSIDRGALEDTLIADGVKIDNLVHLAHNVQIGENTAIAGQVGVAGSTKIGKNCMFGGQAGIAGHIELTDAVTITGQGMITKSIKNPGVYSSGTSFNESSIWRKNAIRFQQLDAMYKRLAKLEKKFEEK